LLLNYTKSGIGKKAEGTGAGAVSRGIIWAINQNNMEEIQNKKKKEKNKKSNILKIAPWIFVSFLVAGLAFSSFYFYQQYKKASRMQAVPEKTDELAVLTNQIGAVMELPDEKPTLATVTDIEQAKSQPFFAKAQNGDKVLIYANAKKAILYRPSQKKIIEVAAVSGLAAGDQAAPSAPEETGNAVQPENLVAENPAAESPQPTEEIKETATAEKIKVAVYNGSNLNGVAAKLAKEISVIEGVEVVEQSNAKDKYPVTFVADLNGNNSALCERIATAVGGQVGVFPENEAMPEGADILVIGGKGSGN